MQFYTSQTKNYNWAIKAFAIFSLLAIFFMLLAWHPSALAETSKGLKGVTKNLTDNIKGMGQLLVYVAYIAGIGFALVGIIQFKAHKDAPTQTPLSKPIIYLVVAGCLLFLPQVMDTAGESIFGDTQNKGAEYESEFN